MAAKGNLVEEVPGTPDSGTLSNEAKILAAAARDRGRSHYSISMMMVSIGTLSYVSCIYYFCRHHGQPESVQKAFYEEVHFNVYMFPMVAFATAMLLNTLSWVFELRPARKQLSILAIYISGVACAYEFLAWANMAPIYITASGRANSLFRYIMWGHATPAMLYALSLISDFTSRRVTIVIAVDIFMIATAIPGELINHWSRWIFNAASCAVFPYVFKELWCMYGDAIAGAGEQDRAAQVSLRALQGFTVSFWTLFPVIWTVVQMQLISVRVEEILWSMADISGKIFFSSSLLHGNFMTIDARRLMAMRVVEEANRSKVIHELRQLVEQKESFIALMSHELRTPLNGIIGLSNALLMEISQDNDTGRTLATIRNSGARLLNLINDILDAAALRKGRLVVGQNRVVLQHAVDDVIELTVPLAKPGVSLSNRISVDIPAVVGDASRLVQVLYNLVGNACKFTQRGEIWVGAEVVDDDDDGDGGNDTTTTAGGGGAKMIAVSIHDTGIGIPREKLEDIFSPFEQVDMSARRQYGGTGLGLNLAKQLVEAHGGTIVVRSLPGQGSTFTFTLKVWKEGQLVSPRHSTSSQRRFAWQRPSFERPTLPLAIAVVSKKTLKTPVESEQQPLLAGKSSSSRRGGGVDGVRISNSNGKGGQEDSCGESSDASGSGFGRDPSAVDLMARLHHDAQPENMLQRLSGDACLRKSLEDDRTLSKKAPQQMSPSDAASSFLFASAPLRSTTSGGCGGGNNNGADVDAPTTSDTPTTTTTSAIRTARPQMIFPSAYNTTTATTTNGDAGPSIYQGGEATFTALHRSAGAPPPSTGTNHSVPLGRANWTAAAAAVAESERAGAVTILSVDDDPINQMVIQAMLRRAGFRVITACDGHKALDLLRSGITTGPAPDMILLDVMMPGMSGYDVVRAIREDYPRLMIPVILVSANGYEDQIVEGLAAGANDYITKPLGQKELVARILSQLRTKKFTEAAAAAATPAAGGGSSEVGPTTASLSCAGEGDGGGVEGEVKGDVLDSTPVPNRSALEEENAGLREMVAQLKEQISGSTSNS